MIRKNVNEKKYIIKFDATSIPPNFNKWKKLDLKKELEDLDKIKKSYSKDNKLVYYKDLLYLNRYKSVLIKSQNSDILEFDMYGTSHKMENKQVYFIFFPEYHDCFLKINSSNDIEVYVPDDTNELIEIQKLYELFKKDYIILLDKINNDEYQFLIGSGMIGTGPRHLNEHNLIVIDENKFYYELEQFEKDTNENFDEINFNEKITILDKYIQNDIIKICQKNNN